MQLLHWSTLRPAGPDNLAVVRFLQPVRVQSIRIFPKDSTPFKNCPEVVAETEPQAFFLDIFLNAQPDLASDKPKNWTQNTLVPTKLAYPGGLLDFPVSWSVQCTTRLVIFRGQFQALSLALYGTCPQLGIPPNVHEYTPSPLPQDLVTRPLIPALDPSATSDPTNLARSLLSLIPDDAAFPRPSIPLLLRLMFCLKAPDKDWDTPGFPYIFADIESLNHRERYPTAKREDDEEDAVLLSDEDEEIDPEKEEKSLGLAFLRRVSAVTTRPAADEIPRETIIQLASRIATAVHNEQESSKEVAVEIAKILKNCASQHPTFIISIMTHVSLSAVFSSGDVLTEDVLSYLIDAAANPDLAHSLSIQEFITLLRELCGLPCSTSPNSSISVAVVVPTENAGETDQVQMAEPLSPSASPVTLMSPISTTQTLSSTNLHGHTTRSNVGIPDTKLAPLVASSAQRALAMDLLELLFAQALLEDGLSNTRAQFSLCVDGIWKALGTSEAVVGAWIENMVWERVKQEAGEDVCRMGTTLRENAVVPGVRSQSWGKVVQGIMSSEGHRLREAVRRWNGTGELGLREDEDVGVEFRMTHAEFIAFLRAYIGVGCVVGVFAWADSCPDTSCRERALEIIRVWQNVEGYKQITKHFLLLPQMVKRLECNISGYDVPHTAGVLAEKILASVISEPSVLSSHPAVTDNVLKLGKRSQDEDTSQTAEDDDAQGQTLTYISSQTLLEMRKMALVADDGLPGALDELKFFAAEKRDWDKASAAADGLAAQVAAGTEDAAGMNVDKPEGPSAGGEDERPAERRSLSLRRLRTLRVAMSVVMQELSLIAEQRDGPSNPSTASSLHQAISTIHREEGSGLFYILADLVEVTSEDLAEQFKPLRFEASLPSGTQPSILSTATTEQLLLANRDALVMMTSLLRIGLSPSLTMRTIRTLVIAIADTYVSADMALMALGISADHAGLEGSWWASGADGDLGGAAGAGAGVYAAASSVRRACKDLMHNLGTTKTASGRDTSVIMIKALLHAGELCARGWRSRDPGLSITQVCHLINEAIPPMHEGNANNQGSPEEQSGEYTLKARWATVVLPQILLELQSFLKLVDVENRLHLTRRLVAIDDNVTGIGPWLVSEELRHATSTLQALKPRVELAEDSPHRVQHLLRLHKASQTLQYLFTLVNDPSTAWFLEWLSPSGDQDVSRALRNFLEALIDCHLTSSLCLQVIRILSNNSDTLDPSLNMGFMDLLFQLRNMQSCRPVPLDSLAILSRIKALPSSSLVVSLLRQELGRTFMVYANPESTLEKITLETSESILTILEWMLEQGNSEFSTITGMTGVRYNRLCDRMYQLLPYSRSDILHEVRSQFTVEEPPDGVPSSLQQLPSTVELSVRDIELLSYPQRTTETPPRHTPDVLAPIVSPPSALLRSPAATGLTKTYNNDDFRQLRVMPTSRQNTSRLPSTHVDEFETSPLMMPTAVPGVLPSLNLANFE